MAAVYADKRDGKIPAWLILEPTMIRIDAHDASKTDTVVHVLRQGGVVCIPTDTAYGLAVDPGNRRAVERLFDLKGRPHDKPIPMLVDSVEMMETVARPTSGFERIAARFWPGPLTLVVGARESLSERITSGTAPVGVRWPNAEFPLRVMAACGHPLTATSANRSGKPIARTVDEAAAQLGPDLDAVVDAGPLRAVAPSTVLDLTSVVPEVLREGPVSYDELATFLGGRLRRRPA